MKEAYLFAMDHGNIVTRVWLDEGNQIAEGSKKVQVLKTVNKVKRQKIAP